MQHNSAQKIRFLVGVAGAALAAIGPVAAHAQAAAEDKTTTPTADAKPQDNQQGLADIVKELFSARVGWGIAKLAGLGIVYWFVLWIGYALGVDRVQSIGRRTVEE